MCAAYNDLSSRPLSHVCTTLFLGQEGIGHNRVAGCCGVCQCGLPSYSASSPPPSATEGLKQNAIWDKVQ